MHEVEFLGSDVDNVDTMDTIDDDVFRILHLHFVISTPSLYPNHII